MCHDPGVAITETVLNERGERARGREEELRGRGSILASFRAAARGPVLDVDCVQRSPMSP